MKVTQYSLPDKPYVGEQDTSENTGITYEFDGKKWVPVPANQKHIVDEEVTLICT